MTDAVFKALAHPDRREVLDMLRERPRTTGELCTAFTVSRFAVMKHLARLVEAGLVVAERRGRSRLNHLNPVPIRQLYRRWIRPFEEDAADGLIRLKRHAERSPQEIPMSHSPSPFAVAETLLEIRIDARIERVWQALTTELTAWWPTSFNTRGADATMRLEARPGGRLWEDWGDGDGAVFASVIWVETPTTLRLAADQFPAWGGPGRSMAEWTLEEDGDATRLRFRDTRMGVPNPDNDASMDQGWQFLLDALQAHVEGRPLPEWTG